MLDPRVWLRRLPAAALAAVCLAGPPVLAQSTLEPTPQSGGGFGFQPGAPNTTALWRPGDPGERLHLRVRVLGTSGRAVPGALVRIRQTDGTGEYQPDRYQATVEASEGGRFQLSTVLPGQYYGAKHIHVIVTHPRYERLVTQVLFKGDPYIDEAEVGDLAIALEKVQSDGETVLVGGVDFVLRPLGAN